MSLAEHLRTILIDDPTVSGLVGAHIYRVKGPREVIAPMVLFSFTGHERIRSLSGTTEHNVRTVRFECFGRDADEAEMIVQAINDVLEDYSGTIAGVQIDDVADIQDFDDEWSDDVDQFHSTLVADVWYQTAN